MNTSIIKSNTVLILLGLLVSVFMCVLPHTTHAALTDGLVGHWTFDGKDMLSSTTVRDISTTRATGTLTNMDQKSSRVLGKFGQALKFDGVDDGISMTSNSIIGTSVPNGYTTSLWFKADNKTGYVLERGYDEPSVTLNISGNYYVLCTAKDSAGTQFSVSSSTISYLRNAWNHVACVMNANGDTYSMYQNGVFLASTTVTGGNTLRSTTAYSIGRRSQVASNYLNGSVDDVRVYNRALSALEITQLYKQGATKLGVTPSRNITSASTTCTGISCGLVGHWTFDGKDINWATKTTFNRGGNGNNGTLVGLSATSSARTGKLGQAMFFPSTATSSVIVGTNPKPTGDFTISFWMYQNIAGSVFVSNYNGYGGDAITMNDNGFWLTLDVNDEYIQISRSQIPTRKWYYISGVRDSVTGVLSLYVNGVLAKASAPGTSMGPLVYTLNGIMAFGAYTGILTSGQNGCNCIMDDVRIYNRALSASEITQLYKQGGTKLGVTQPRSATTTTSATGIGAGLVGHWTFDGKDTTWTSATAGTVRDVSGNGNTGTFSNMRRAAAPVVGKVGQGITFVTSQSQDVAITATAPYTGTTMTFATWFKRADNISSEQVFMFSDIGFGLRQNRLVIQDFAGGRLSPDVGVISTPNTYTDMNWHHAVFTSDGNGSKIYVDGALATSSPVTIVSAGSKNTGRIGSSNSRYFNGALDDVRIYNRVLSAAEIGKLYKLGQTRMR